MTATGGWRRRRRSRVWRTSTTSLPARCRNSSTSAPPSTATRAWSPSSTASAKTTPRPTSPSRRSTSSATTSATTWPPSSPSASMPLVPSPIERSPMSSPPRRRRCPSPTPRRSDGRRMSRRSATSSPGPPTWSASSAPAESARAGWRSRSPARARTSSPTGCTSSSWRACSNQDSSCPRSPTPSACATTARPRWKNASPEHCPAVACSSPSTTSSR
ncbi:hypothetical protein VF08_37740 [Nostoc linckia z8]|uniref:Uncharacterized protein n=1 Tax=Nostoc linckia z8 TaxID=1628746 RepID=A0A9Q6EGQ3_NOSLI|nr:hypothetical protein VF08_37740 [Nostoc linckia z8]